MGRGTPLPRIRTPLPRIRTPLPRIRTRLDVTLLGKYFGVHECIAWLLVEATCPDPDPGPVDGLEWLESGLREMAVKLVESRPCRVFLPGAPASQWIE